MNREIWQLIADFLWLISGYDFFKKIPTSGRALAKVQESYLTFDKKIYSHMKVSFSQEGEDLVLRRFLENKKRGFYVDIGACHPQRFSNTMSFYLDGWSGISIEPNPEVIDLFREIRPRDINLNFGIGVVADNIEYFMFAEAALNTFSLERVEELASKKENYNPIKKIKVEVKPLSEILTMHLPKSQEITFMSVDCEGYDYQVLISNDWKIYRPRFVLVECLMHYNDLELAFPVEQDPCAFMSSVGYRKIAKTFNTVFFAD